MSGRRRKPSLPKPRPHSCSRATGSTTASAWASPISSTGRSRRAPPSSRRQDPHLRHLAPRAVLEADPEGRHFLQFNWHFSRLRPRPARRRPLQLHPDELRRGARLLPPLRRSVDVVVHQDLRRWTRTAISTSAAPSPTTRRSTERAKILIVETIDRACRYVFGAEEAVHASEVDYVIDGDDGARARARRTRRPTEIDRKVGRAHRRRGRGRRLPADRHRRHAERRLHAPEGRRRPRPRHPHRDAGRRHDRSRSKPGIVTGARKRSTPARSSSPSPPARGGSTTSSTATRRCRPSRSTTPTCRSNIMQNDKRRLDQQHDRRSTCRARPRRSPPGHRHLSGTGGQLQFVRGAYASRGGKSFICLVVDVRHAAARREAASCSA